MASARDFIDGFYATVGERLELGSSVSSVLERELSQISGFSEGELQEIRKDVTGRGPLSEYLGDPEVTEIIVDGFDSILIEKNGRLQRAERGFLSPVSFERTLRELLLECNQTVDARFPFADGRLPCGTRLHVIQPPASDRTVLTLRKHNCANWVLGALLQAEMLDQQAVQLLRSLVLKKKNLIVVGPTGVGKTTLLRALLHEIPTAERLVVIEDTPEIAINRENTAFLRTRNDVQGLAPTISLQTLLKNSLRMRPDRILLGEVRGEEALTLLDMLSTGHGGSICTLHASSTRQALQRLESLVLRAAPQWSLQAVRQLILESVQGIILLDKTEAGLRRLIEIAQPAGIEEFGLLLETLYDR